MLDEQAKDKPLPQGADALWHAGIGCLGRMLRRQRRILARAHKVLALEKSFAGLTDHKLQEQAQRLREIFRLVRDKPRDLECAFALVREVAARQIGERPFAVQVAGGLALAAGSIVEMATGEGKTLTATMPAVVAGWRGRGCHVITVNDYLARRDAEWMKHIYRFCGLGVSFIEQAMEPLDRRKAYGCDITYATNKEITADFLRDRLQIGRLHGAGSAVLGRIASGGRSPLDRLVQRGLAFAIVDEADSVLVDEAVTPLIISGPGPNREQLEAFRQAAAAAAVLGSPGDYRINLQYREVELTPEGRSRLAQAVSSLPGLWQGARRREELVTKALVARELYLKDKHYIIDGGKVVIVDDFTGRVMPDRSWRDGLHQAVEAKESVEITDPKDTYARISFQRFFRMYKHLCGMTGTAKEAAAEFWQIYGRPIVVIPTNRPCRRKVLPDVVLATRELKWQRLVQEVHRIHDTARPILIGTRSVRDSEQLSELLRAERLDHQVLNAVRHKEEAQIVAGAGQSGQITVATNMAGRGTDIKLGRGVAELGGLHVIAAERNESGRIDRQLFGRCARQGDPGTAQAIVSLEDEFLCRYAGTLVRHLHRRHAGTSDNIASGVTRLAFAHAQRRAERFALQQRKSVMRSDHWLDENLGFAGGM
ncbi:MAG: preprotein translocase subunit SecA [Phycisphaerales bacterium]